MIQEYIEYIRDVRRLSTQTVDGYRKDLRQFVAWARPQGLTWRTLKREDCERWMAEMKRQGMAPATTNRRLTAVRSCLQWAFRHGMLEENAWRFCQRAREADRMPQTVDVAAVDAYLATPSTDGVDDITRAMVAIMIETGMRIGELCTIRTADVDTLQRSMRITGKGSKERTVYYGERTAQALQKLHSAPNGTLFPAMATTTRRALIKAALKPYTGEMHAHMLRHTFATAMLNNGARLETLSHLMGHTHSSTTQRYARLSNERTRLEYEQHQF